MKTPDEIKQGLECCNTYNDCQSCPYGDKVEKGWGCCVQRNADALAYIRQLESKLAEYEKPIKPLTFTEAMNADDLVWLEMNAENDRQRIAEVVPCVTKPEERAEILLMGSSRVAHLPYDHYGSSWRCWSRKPTDAERKAAKWNE